MIVIEVASRWGWDGFKYKMDEDEWNLEAMFDPSMASPCSVITSNFLLVNSL